MTKEKGYIQMIKDWFSSPIKINRDAESLEYKLKFDKMVKDIKKDCDKVEPQNLYR